MTMTSMATREFQDAAREWRALLAARGAADSPAETSRFDTAMRVAIALFSRSEGLSEPDSAAVRAASHSDRDEQELLALATALRRLLDAIVRDRMSFLLPGGAQPAPSAVDASASQREALAQQQTLRELLPSAFRERFRQQLLDHWEELMAVASANKPSLPRVAQLDWSVAAAPAAATVLLRVQTSDGDSRRVLVSQRELHRLRYSAAKALQSMRQVEAHPIMRLAHMAQQVDASVQAAAATAATAAGRAP